MKKAIITFILIISSCSSSKNITGTYRSNFADLGFFITTIKFKKDSTFEYNYSGDLVNTDLTGSYKIKNRILYLKFKINKGGIESESDSLSISEMLSGNYHNYNLKSESGTEFHLKYLIRKNKLFNYNIKDGKVVNFGKYYSNNKWKKKRAYLKKQIDI